MPVRKPKPVEAGDGSYAGLVLQKFDEMAAPAAAAETPAPCPFCGGTDIAPAGCWGCDEDDNDGVHALCRGCEAQGPFVRQIGRPAPPHYEPTPETVAASVAAWNRRG